MARTIDEVEDRLGTAAPWCDPNPAKMRASVALILREMDDDLEALFIRRADHEGDPWSGHLALPGGRIDSEDADARGAAERETREELDLDLTRARCLGRLSDVLGFAESIRVSAFVYGVQGDPPLKPNYEIREAFWFSLGECENPARQEEREFKYLDHSMLCPTIRMLEDERAPVLWGITYKFMDDFMGTIGRPIPFMPWEDDG